MAGQRHPWGKFDPVRESPYMRLGSVSVWFPVLHLRAEVTYRLLPELTPLHRALEAAVNEFASSSNPLAAVPISALFRQLFGISGSQEILPDVLSDLIDRGRVHRVVEDEVDPLLLRIIDLAPGRSRTDLGRRSNLSETEKQSAQTRKIERFFDPVLEEIVDGNDLAIEVQDDQRFCVPAEPFLRHPPTHWVERELRTEIRDDVQLYTAASELVGHRWRCSKAELVLQDGELSVECGDPRESEYLRGLSQLVRRSWLPPNSLDRSFLKPVTEGVEYSIDCQLPRGLGGLLLTRGLPGPVRAGLALVQSVVLVELDPAADIKEPTIISMSSEKQAMQIAYPRNDNLGISGVFWATEGREFFRLPVIWEGMHAEIGAYRAASGFLSEGSAWRDVIAALETECRFSDTPEVVVLPAHWLAPADFWRRLYEQSCSLADGHKWMLEIVKALKKLPYPVLESLLETLSRDLRLENLRKTHPELADLDPSAKELASSKQKTTRDLVSVPQSCDRVIAFDTSSFIQFDDLVDHLLPTDFLVFPQTVAGEVERKKGQRDDFRMISRRNLRSVRQLPGDRWAAPFHDFSFLAPGDVPNEDGQIIATLIPYRQAGNRVILVTQDGDFVVRCKPYGIETMTAEIFMSSSKDTKKRR
jgi:hypothetical protein